MSRSRKKKFAKIWIGSHSAKEDKRIASRAFRRSSKQANNSDKKEPLYSKHQAVNQYNIGGDWKMRITKEENFRK